MRTLHRERQPKRFKYLVIAAILLGIYSISQRMSASQPVISPIAEAKTTPAKKPFLFFGKKEEKKDPQKLKDAVRAVVKGRWANYSVYVVDYTSDFSMGINETVIYTAASISKVPILTALYDAAMKGSIDLDHVVTVQESDVQDYGTGSIRYAPANSSYSVKTLAQLMMQQSDNTAAHILGSLVVGLPNVESYINGLGLVQTDLEANKVSNRDLSVLFRKIYDKSITTPALSEEMIGFMKNSDFEDRLPGKLPKTATVIHKIGTGIGNVHDAGIVMDGSSAYYIGVLTSDTPDEEQSSEIVADISRTVYDFMISP